ncbi:membrane-associated guanylate kinase, WW and PDZ domain-containing protein 1 isoform X2 [Culicoides brevitarsis]|uniref:membrane-associated guanylate kinase, WW and PDZ domain-containing protein 1 isoform X2 n=1 Tax=Culicoides brevitarsis TaxID=469753 RepID=UPI00307C4DC6
MDNYSGSISTISEINNSQKCKQTLQYNDDHLGPLPNNWEKAQTEQGEIYFIDHNTGSSHWLDPRLSKFQKRTLEDCGDDELPFGWDVVFDSQYGTYYIDHVNRKTQYENPVIQAKRLAEQARSQMQNIYENHFTKDASKLLGERIITKLIKSQNGFGFTIIGGDNNEFLQIKSILPNGPAWNDGKLKTGDVLVNVCGVCVLGFSHHDVINIFQSILPDGYATIEVCRGYDLPPDDPTNTEVITIVAVDSQNSSSNITETLALNIFKEETFGFTISDSLQGQKVKSIIDNRTCKNIYEGDILLAINGINVKQMSHNKVVEVLKDCPQYSETLIQVLRNRQLRDNRKINENIYSNKLLNLYRSKTPTAENYSSEPKIIVPIRSKTPDSRLCLINDSENSELYTNMKKRNDFFECNYLDNDKKTNSIDELNIFMSNLANHYNNFEVDRIYDKKYNGSKSTKAEMCSIFDNSNDSRGKPESNYHCSQENYVHYENQDCNIEPQLNQLERDMQLSNLRESQRRTNDKWNLYSSKHIKDHIFKIMLDSLSTGFGFRIVGGIEESSPITVGYIVPGGAADINGRIKTGDEILSINETSLKKLSHHHVVQLMLKAADRGHAFITIKRRISYPYDVFITRHENEGFGFVIISSSSHTCGSVIGKLIFGSPAEKSGEVKVGDLIVAVNGINITNMSHGDVVNLIKESGLQVQLTIESPRENIQEFIEQETINQSMNNFPIIC